MLSGEFLQYGPLSYFQSSGTTDSGLVQESGSGRPLLVTMGKSEDALIRNFMSGEADELPVDASLGDVVAVTETRDSLMEHLRKGGLWVYPILAFALVAFVVSVVKLVQIFSVREPRPMVVHDMVKAIRAGDVPAAEKLAQSVPAPAREMLLAAAAHAGESIELVEEVMYECMLSVQPRLERFLNIIAVTAATAPLLGLLGTVTGIIQTFSLMRIFGAGDPKPLLSGISEALITTELGLILAIPSLVIHSLLSRRVAGILSRMEKLSVAFVNGLSRRDPVKTSTADGVE
jgi:biopolymer transport protein ExbB